ncbi:phage virion morphogenesis protein [Sinimarinibacterium sp. NLF-5-8]|uniref:phage virion morphogenesis protein n=1 Tax=Sinimarinibacterium sp. NLF-5-8 TaxID=2698684 RepID=UPI00137BFE38|nr:phage virion morphogenesis protein [Sinimarinibacterium sp. NLF-5-8]QHS11274.1 hypothetical protein GT972_14695 [Sinimarinibacterium sp. NLF-5-8]
MTDTIKITFDDAAAQATFERLMRFGRDARPMFLELSKHLTESTQRRFKTSTDPDDVPWVDLKRGKRKPLVDSGTLRNQIYPRHGADFAEVVATAKYARFHQEGTEPFVILPKKGKALAFPGRDGGTVFSKKVNPPGLPKRAFIGLSNDDKQAIERIAKAYLDPD